MKQLQLQLEEWPMAIQAAHQAVAKAVEQEAEALDQVVMEWHQVLKRLEARDFSICFQGEYLHMGTWEVLGLGFSPTEFQAS